MAEEKNSIYEKTKQKLDELLAEYKTHTTITTYSKDANGNYFTKDGNFSGPPTTKVVDSYKPTFKAFDTYNDLVAKLLEYIEGYTEYNIFGVKTVTLDAATSAAGGEIVPKVTDIWSNLLFYRHIQPYLIVRLHTDGYDPNDTVSVVVNNVTTTVHPSGGNTDIVIDANTLPENEFISITVSYTNVTLMAHTAKVAIELSAQE